MKNRFESNPKKTLVAVLFFLFAIVIAAFELTLSVFHKELGIDKPDGPVQHRYLSLREWPPNSRAVFRPPEVRKNDPLGPVDDQYVLSIDQNGFIEPSIVHDAADLEIVFIGGSTTECLYVRPDVRFPYLAGRMLEKTLGLKVNALNAGKSGNHTLHSILSYLGKVAPRRPDYVVLMHATNDLGILNSQSSYWNEKPGIEVVLDARQIKQSGPVTRAILQARDYLIPYTYLVIRNGYKAAREAIAGLFRPAQSADKIPVARAGDGAQQEQTPERRALEYKRREVLRQSFEPALRTFVRSVGAWGSQPVLMTQVLVNPGESDVPAQEGEFLSPGELERGNFNVASFKSAHEYANAIIRHVALSEGAMLIDLAAARTWSAEDVYDGLHFTETGSRRVATAVAAALADRINNQSSEAEAKNFRHKSSQQ